VYESLTDDLLDRVALVTREAVLAGARSAAPAPSS
jgi:hypothetical protein